MSEQLQTFKFNTHTLRMITDDNGEPWFIAMDVSEILEYSDTHEMTKKLDYDEKSNRQIAGLGTDTGGRGVTIINESGLYSAVITSHKPEAKAFKRWVTHEVLPAIRKTGTYTQPGQLNNPFKDIIPEVPPFQRLNSALMLRLRRISPALEQAYLIEVGITPEYIKQQLEKLDGQVAIGLNAKQTNTMPFALLQQEIPLQAEAQDEGYFYFRRPAFVRMCGDYDVTDTARMLRDLDLLKHNPQSLMCRAPRSLFDGRRMTVFAVKKSILGQ